MQKIDFDKFIASLINHTHCHEDVRQSHLIKALDEQGLEYKDGEIVEVVKTQLTRKTQHKHHDTKRSKTMEAKDLMIGDWVQCEGDYRTIGSLEIDETGEYWFWSKEHQALCLLSEHEPIPLTPEILEKNGFEKKWHDRSKLTIFDPRNDDVTSVSYDYRNATVTIDALSFMLVNKHNMRGQKLDSVQCRFVHELQHALRICGIEKKIEL